MKGLHVESSTDSTYTISYRRFSTGVTNFDLRSNFDFGVKSSQFSFGEVVKAYQDHQHTHLVPDCKKNKLCIFYISGAAADFDSSRLILHPIWCVIRPRHSELNNF